MVVLADDTSQNGLLPIARYGCCENSVIADFVVQRFVVCAAAWHMWSIFLLLCQRHCWLSKIPP